MRTLIASLGLVCLASFAAETAPADPLKGKPIAHWIKRLASEEFDERDEATTALSDAGERVVPDLKKALESNDNEVRLRARMILAAVALANLEGEFTRVGSESFSESGRRTVQSNEAGNATLTVSKGRVIFQQDYSKGITQVYTFPETTSLQFRRKCDVALKWESINTDSGYNPDREDVTIACVSTEEGVKIVFSARDTADTSFKMTFLPTASVKKEKPKK